MYYFAVGTKHKYILYLYYIVYSPWNGRRLHYSLNSFRQYFKQAQTRIAAFCANDYFSTWIDVFKGGNYWYIHFTTVWHYFHSYYYILILHYSISVQQPTPFYHDKFNNVQPPAKFRYIQPMPLSILLCTCCVIILL